MRFYIKTFGCRTNIAESEWLTARLVSLGFQVDEEKPDIIVINTCTVTENASRKIRQFIHSVKKAKPFSTIIVFGCGVREKNNQYGKMAEVDTLMKEDKDVLDYYDYLKVEHWYLNIAIDKNFANILNQARKERNFVERLLFTEDQIPFKIDRESIKLLHVNGLIKEDNNGYVTFWVPFYKKRLYDAFYPYMNGEKTGILRSIVVNTLFDTNGNIKFDELIAGYKEYVKRRGFKVFMEKDENGNYKSIKESALIYSFETYIQAFLQMVKGKSYREADTGLGKSDLIINVNGKEHLIETKIYYYESRFLEGKEQLAYYCQSLGLNKGIYLVFCPDYINYAESIKEQKEKINNVDISTFLIEYDDRKW